MPSLGTKKLTLKPYWQTSDGNSVRLYLGDVLETLRKMPSKSVQMVVTSPPYWALRDYGTGEWVGGKKDCDHKVETKSDKSRLKPSDHSYVAGWTPRDMTAPAHYKCPKCGAKRIDQQLGSEATPQEFVRKMVEVFREVHRVLRDDGTLWLNMGDTYASSGNKGKSSADVSDEWDASKERAEKYGYTVGGWGKSKSAGQGASGRSFSNAGLKPGNLVGVPWRLALALQEDGWVLRQDVIWYKPSPMPESCTNRCTKAHEYVFLLTKGQKYFYDADAIREESLGVPQTSFRSGRYTNNSSYDNDGEAAEVVRDLGYDRTGRNKRSIWEIDNFLEEFLQWISQRFPNEFEELLKDFSDSNKLDVWKVASQGYEGAHFATFPPDLIEPTILAGTSEYGACVKCGAPWKRVTEKTQLKRDRPNDYVKRTGEEGTGNSCANSVAGVETKTLGWEPTCWCGKGVNPTTKVRPCIVLDPFMGSGTTAVVALDKGRWSWGIELNEKYIINNAIPRIEGAIYSRPGLAHLLNRKVEKIDLGEELL